MKQKEFAYVIIFFILSLITLTASVFAWLNISKTSKIGGIDSNLPDFTNLITFWVQRNEDGAYIEINSIEDMESVFGDTKPGEAYTFFLRVNNKSKKELNVIASITNIRTLYHTDDTENNYNILDVFYIKDGKIDAYYEVNGEYMEYVNPYYYNETHQNSYLKDLVNENGNIPLFPSLKIGIDKQIFISFTLVYDKETTDIRYQDNKLKFDGIYIYGQ